MVFQKEVVFLIIVKTLMKEIMGIPAEFVLISVCVLANHIFNWQLHNPFTVLEILFKIFNK